MQKLNDPKIAIILVIVAAALIFASVKFTKKVNHSDAKSSIYLDEKDQQDMIKAFQDGSAYTVNPGDPTAAAQPPSPAGQ